MRPTWISRRCSRSPCGAPARSGSPARRSTIVGGQLENLLAGARAVDVGPAPGPPDSAPSPEELAITAMLATRPHGSAAATRHRWSSWPRLALADGTGLGPEDRSSRHSSKRVRPPPTEPLGDRDGDHDRRQSERRDSARSRLTGGRRRRIVAEDEMPAIGRLLERGEELADRASAMADVRTGAGALLTIEGEAEVGRRRAARSRRRRRGTVRRDGCSGPAAASSSATSPTASSASSSIRSRAIRRSPSCWLEAPPVQGPSSTSPPPPPTGATPSRSSTASAASSPASPIPRRCSCSSTMRSGRPRLAARLRLRRLPPRRGLRAGADPDREKRRARRARALLDELRRQPGAVIIEPPPLAAVAAVIAAHPGGPTGEAARPERHATPPVATRSCSASFCGRWRGAARRRIARSRSASPSWSSGASRAILGRPGRPGANAVATARAVAVLERDRVPDRALGELDPGAVPDDCERLVRAGLLTDSQPVAFVHPLLRAAVLGEIAAPRRASDHGRAARLLAADDAPADAVAAHLLLTEPSGDPAVAALRAAAAEALGRGAPPAAVAYLRRVSSGSRRRAGSAATSAPSSERR